MSESNQITEAGEVHKGCTAAIPRPQAAMLQLFNDRELQRTVFKMALVEGNKSAIETIGAVL